MGELPPEAFKVLRSLKNRLAKEGCGIPRDKISERIIEVLNKAGKIYFDEKGNVVYLVQLSERLSPVNRKWHR